MTSLDHDIPGAYSPDDLACLQALEARVQWLSAWTIHHANTIRESRDGLKVGGHQASCASMSTIMTALYFHVLNPIDRIAVKPHASPVFHAIQYLLGQQSREQLEAFRAFGGAQSYPSRTKDQDDVDFSTGSVGLGVAITAFASLTQDYLAARGRLPAHKLGRMIALLGDAELDEGNVYEALLESAKHDIRNTWWIVDYNRQSLDAVTPEHMGRRITGMVSAAGWQVVTLRWGRKLQAVFDRPGGQDLRLWIETCPNDLYAALTYEGGAAWRAILMEDLPQASAIRGYLDGLDDTALADIMTNLAGHCLPTLLDTFHAISDDAPRLFLVYTIKGYGLPFQGHKDNHAGLMTARQMDTLRTQMGVPEGAEWDPLAGVEQGFKERLKTFLAEVPFASEGPRRFAANTVPAGPRAAMVPKPGGKTSTQAAFGRILADIAKENATLADHIVTTSPDVTVSTNLGPWVNARGLFSRKDRVDLFRSRKIASPQRWQATPKGQHIELGIAEHNLFLMLGALGISAPLFGQRLLPIGTLYDPFIARGLDALNYAAYQDARFMLVATPSGLTLGPEGGAHQSIYTPLIGMGQPGLTYFEPAYADELGTIMHWAFEHMQAEDGGSVYLRLSTRALEQIERPMSNALSAQILDGAYWVEEPGTQAPLVLVYCGAIAPEVRTAFSLLKEDLPGAGLLAVTSPDRLHQNWCAAQAQPWTGQGPAQSTVSRLLEPLSPDAVIVTVHDGAPSALSWLGSVRGHRTATLGLDRFGQVGALDELYQEYRLDAEAILDAAAGAILGL